MMNLRKRKTLIIEEEQKIKERVIAQKRRKIDEEQKKKETLIAQKRKKIDEAQKKKETLIAQKRKKIDEDLKKMEMLIAKKRKKIEEEQKKYEMLIAKKRDKIEEEQNKYEIVIAKKRKKYDEEQKKNELVILKKRKQIGEENEIVVANKIDDHPPCPSLPEDLIIYSILTRLPARDLARYSRVSKLWYNSICNNKPFASSHFVQNKNQLSLVFHLLNVWEKDFGSSYFFSVEEKEEGKCLKVMCLQALGTPSTRELVGYCNGLACLKPMSGEGRITVINPTREEILALSALNPPEGGYIYLCHGFGFDASSGEYKTVIVFTSATNEEFVCMIFTLGTYSWRKITTTAAEMSTILGGSSLFPASRMVTRVLKDFCRSAIPCGGDLYWRITNQVVEEDIEGHNGNHNNDNKIEMLLSFDLHNEKIQFVRLPDECTANEDQYLVVDNLLEFRGYPCVARSEKIVVNDSDRRLHHCNYRSNFCCCCCKVHLYILKDKVKQKWVKEETYDVQIKEKGSLTTPFCSYIDTTTATPPTRMLSLSDQVLLYWFDGKCLIIYDLLKKHLKVVRSSVSYPGIFKAKMSDLDRSIDNDDSAYCVDMDYQLHAQVENILSLKTFIPGGETTQFDSVEDFRQAKESKRPAGWVITGSESKKYHTFS